MLGVPLVFPSPPHPAVSKQMKQQSPLDSGPATGPYLLRCHVTSDIWMGRQLLLTYWCRKKLPGERVTAGQHHHKTIYQPSPMVWYLSSSVISSLSCSIFITTKRRESWGMPRHHRKKSMLSFFHARINGHNMNKTWKKMISGVYIIVVLK